MTPEDRKQMMNWIADHGADHDDDCPSDDTCSCSMKPKNDAIQACCVFLHNAPARIAALELALSEQAEAVRVLAKAYIQELLHPDERDGNADIMGNEIARQATDRAVKEITEAAYKAAVDAAQKGST